jgi:hypothetical protein
MKNEDRFLPLRGMMWYSHLLTGNVQGKLLMWDPVLMPHGSSTDNCSYLSHHASGGYHYIGRCFLRGSGFRMLTAGFKEVPQISDSEIHKTNHTILCLQETAMLTHLRVTRPHSYVITATRKWWFHFSERNTRRTNLTNLDVSRPKTGSGASLYVCSILSALNGRVIVNSEQERMC